MFLSAEAFHPSSGSDPEPQTLHYTHPLQVLWRRMCSARETQVFISRRLQSDLYALTYLPPAMLSSRSHPNHVEHDKCLSNRRYKLHRALLRSTRAELTIIHRRQSVETKIQLHQRWLTTSDTDVRKKSIIAAYDAASNPAMDEAAATEAWSPYHDPSQPIWLLNSDLAGTPGHVFQPGRPMARGVFWDSPTAHNAFIRPTTFHIPPPDLAEGEFVSWYEDLGFVHPGGYFLRLNRYNNDDRLEVVEEQTRTMIVHGWDARDRDGREESDDGEGQGRPGETEYTGDGFMDPRRLSGPWFFGFGYDAPRRRIGYC